MKGRSTILKMAVATLLLMAMLICHAQAQEITISGRVISKDDNQPMPGVSIVIKGIAQGAVTDADGLYKINVLKGSTLVFSFLGMDSQEFSITDQTTINVTLISNITSLGEVVVTALGIKRERKTLGYSVAEVNGSQLSTALEVNPINSLSGKVAGVDISLPTAGPSGSSRVVIRGNSQLSGNNQPLYVIDGVPMENTQMSEGAGMWGGYDLGNGVSNLNANDIESVSVLKGASASALYGSRASNGVILITTKSGKAQKGVGVEYTSNYTVEKVLSKFDDYQTVYGQGRDGMIPNADNVLTTQVAWGAKLDPNLTVPIYNKELKPYGLVNNNILSFFRPGSTATNTIAVSGGNDIANVRASISDMRNKDIIPNTGLNRNTFLINTTVKLGSKLTVSAKANYVTEKVNNRPALSDNPNNVGLAVIGIAPNFNQRWLSEGYKDKYGNYVDWNGNIYRINPYWSINEMSNVSTKNRLMGFLQLNYAFTNWLSLQARGGTDYTSFHYTNYMPKGTPVWNTGALEEVTRTSAENNYEAMLKFNKDFGSKFSVTAFAGGNIRHNKMEAFNATGKGIVLDGVKSITNFTSQTIGNDFYERQVNSAFGSVQLGYKDTYFLDATARNDWSSTLKKGNNSYFYPSVSGSFIFSNLIKGQTPLTFGKLRSSWAEVGGDADPYQLNLTYGLKNFSLLGKPLGEISNTSIPNLQLKPTRTYS
ncbi:MAG TPA: SusC/RagA family TonB-linked outer membrane protein, partial [Cyclobacteriaceae bacterium]|nr:SusC/RagA family TonB-linked outer membrane protein [Cyclobacteriaceae bacterium]